MVRKFFLLFIPYVLFALDCGHFFINYSKDNILIYQKKELIKEIELGYEIKKIDCFYDRLLAISTPKFLFVATADGELLKKQSFYRTLIYAYTKDNTVFFTNPEKTQYLKYHIGSNGSIDISKVLLNIAQKNLFLSFDQKGDEILFFDSYYQYKNIKKSIIPLYLKNDKLYYFDKELKDIFYADGKYFQHKINSFPYKKIYYSQWFFQEYSQLERTNQEKIFDYFQDINIKKKLLSLYLQKAPKTKDVELFLDKIFTHDGIVHYYKLLKEKFIKIPYLGIYNIYNINILQKKLKQFQNSVDFKYLSQMSNFYYEVYYPKSPDEKEIILKYFIDKKKFFIINISTKCSMYKKTKQKMNRYKGFLIFTTVKYESMFEVKKYQCQVTKTDLHKILALIEQFDKKVIHSKKQKIKHKWYFTTKKLLYDISAKQTAFGKLMSDAFSGNTKCYDITQQCKKNCRFKNDRNGFFIFSNSDKKKCENFCIDAGVSCNHNKKKLMLKNICRARCIGFNNRNGGFFSRSDYEKCMDRCLQ